MKTVRCLNHSVQISGKITYPAIHFMFSNCRKHNFKSLARTVILSQLIVVLCFVHNNINAQTVVTTPCSCLTYTTIGTTGSTTNIGGIAFSSSVCYLLKGTLIVDSGTNDWEGLRFKMEESSQIVVQTGLDMTNCYVSGCGDMWKGFVTKGTVDFNIHDSFIEDAEFGVRLKTNSSFVCFGTEFINNFIGIAEGSPFEADQSGELIHRAQIWGCEFYTNTSLPDPYPGQYYDPSWPTTPSEIPYDQGYAAIYLSGLTQLNFGYVGATGGDRNKIYQMRNGVILRSSVANISGTDFYDFEGTIALSDAEISQLINDPVLDLNQHAINMYRSTSRVEDNTFDNLMVGIYGLESINTIHDNTIELSTPSPGFGFT